MNEEEHADSIRDERLRFAALYFDGIAKIGMPNNSTMIEMVTTIQYDDGSSLKVDCSINRDLSIPEEMSFWRRLWTGKLRSTLEER